MNKSIIQNRIQFTVCTVFVINFKMATVSSHYQYLVLLLVVSFQLFSLVLCENRYAEVEALNPNQQKAFEKFKKLVIQSLPHDYMKQDIYLVKIFQFNQFSVPRAESHVQRMLKWREEWKIDELVQNKDIYFADIQNEYPVYVDGHDREGRPICEFWFGAWSLRKAALAGKIKKLTEHIVVNCFETAFEKVREQQAKGNNITKYIVLHNMEGFNARDHMCPTCMPFSVVLSASLDHYYTNMCYGFWYINTPDAFATLFRLITPTMSPNTRAAFKTFTSNEREWKPWLEKRVDFNEISHWFGGGKHRSVHE